MTQPHGVSPSGGWGYRILRAAVRALLRVGWGVVVEGIERLPVAPYIITPNHPSEIDPVILSAALPIRPTYLASRHLEQYRVLFAIMRRFDPVFVRRGLNDIGAMRACLERLERGEILVVFPEGRVVQDQALGPLQEGAAFLAIRAQVPVVPVVLIGTAAMWPLGARWPRPARVRVRIGTPLFPPTNEDGSRAAGLTAAIATALIALLHDSRPQKGRAAESGGGADGV